MSTVTSSTIIPATPFVKMTDSRQSPLEPVPANAPLHVGIVGTVALDTIETPTGSRSRILGGSATYAGTAASIFAPTSIVSIVGRDFPREHLRFFQDKAINLDGLIVSEGDTFHWKGYYRADMNQAYTVATDLNVLLEFDPVIPASVSGHDIVFLANIDPELQKKALRQFKHPRLVILDTMNYWIDTKLTALKELLPLIDVLIINDQEVKQLTGIEDNSVKAMMKAATYGVKRIIVKKGEHGSLMYNGKTFYLCPAFPLETVVDPTGAGDSFAGGIAGYLALKGRFDETAFRQAVIVGTLVSSFTVQGFSLETLSTLNWEMLERKYEEMLSYIHVPAELV